MADKEIQLGEREEVRTLRTTIGRPEVDVCLFDPKFGIDLEVTADLTALADIALATSDPRCG
jgi:hypothetical protein